MSFKCLNSKEYENTVADNYLCVPAVIQTILRSEGYTEIDIYDIANYFGVILPDDVSYPKINNVTFSANSYDWGVKIIGNRINQLFTDLGIRLQENFIHINTIDRDFFDESIRGILLNKKHIVVGFNYNRLYKLSNDYCGHVSIIVDVNSSIETVSLLDPGPKDPGIKVVNMYDLYAAISDAKDGLWVISSFKCEKL